MDGDAYRRAQKGSRLLGLVSSEGWNAHTDAALAERARQASGGAGDMERPQLEPDVILVMNLTGAALDRYAVVRLDGALIAPDDAQGKAGFTGRIAMGAYTPSSSQPDQLAVLLEPLASAKIGRAVVSGAVPCRLLDNGASTTQAGTLAGETTHLVTLKAGAVRILYRDANVDADGFVWAYVLLGQASLPGIAVNGVSETTGLLDGVAAAQAIVLDPRQGIGVGGYFDCGLRIGKSTFFPFTAFITILAASVTQAGVVNTTTQAFNGAKDFPSGISAGGVTTPTVTGTGSLDLDSGITLNGAGNIAFAGSSVSIGSAAAATADVPLVMALDGSTVLSFVGGFFVGSTSGSGPTLRTLVKKAGFE